MNKSKELREQRKRLADRMSELVGDGKTPMSAENRTEFERIDKEQDELRSRIEAVEKAETLSAELNESRGRKTVEDSPETRGDKGGENEEYRAAFDSYLRLGMENLSTEERSVLRSGYRSNADKDEKRAQTVTTTAGGYLIPTGFSGKLEESLKTFGGMRKVATVFRTETGNSLPWPTVDDTSNVGELLGINTAAAEQDFTFGQVTFVAYKYSSKMVKVPIELLQDSAFDLNEFLSRALATRIGRITNTHFTTGDNSGKPQGIVAGASSGVTAAAVAAVTYDELLDLVHSVDPSYRDLGDPSLRAGFMFADSTLKALRKVKDGEGNPAWQTGLGAKEPDTILGYPYTINQDVATLAASSKSILFGAMGKYMIRDVMGITLRRLEERYAEAGQVAFLAFSRHDGRLLDSGTDPIKYITQAAA